jgi:hypothetical protein
LNSHHAFVVEYGKDRDVELGMLRLPIYHIQGC